MNIPHLPFIDPNPLPAPFWVFVVLLQITFITHILAMNFMLGGAILAFIARRQMQRNPELNSVYTAVVKKIPTFLAATVTLGVAPLLFLQVLYDRYFYTATVIIAWPWFSIIVLITLAYYGFYLVAFKGSQGNKYGWALITSIILIIIVGYIFSTNITLSQTPQKWAPKYFADTSGWNWNFDDPTIIPRYLHFLLASIAIGGLMITLIGYFRWNQNADDAHPFITFGGKWFMYATALQIVDGVWFLLALPSPHRKLLMGGNMIATFTLLLGLILAPVLIVLMNKTIKKDTPLPGLRLIYGLTLGLVVFMALTRSIIRNSYLKGVFNPRAFSSEPQWGVLLIFFVTFLAGLILWGLMIKKYFFTPEALKEAK